MKLDLRHSTTYRYSEPIMGGLQQLRLVPRSDAGQAIDEWSVDIEGATTQVTYLDEHDNHVELVSLDPGENLSINVAGVATTEDLSGVIGFDNHAMPVAAYRRTTPLTMPGPLLATLLTDVNFGSEVMDVERLHELSNQVADRIEYAAGHTDASTTAEQALAGGAGVCQDHAHVFIAACRSLGVPARYVSGYLMMQDTVEQAATHAWAQAYVVDLGWVGFDISNRISPDDRYVRLAVGLDYRDAAPVSGVRSGGGDETLEVSLSVAAGALTGDVAQPQHDQ